LDLLKINMIELVLVDLSPYDPSSNFEKEVIKQVNQQVFL